MVANKFEIYNMALAHLRQRPLLSETDLSPEANYCRQFYPQALELSLRVGDWPFARFSIVGEKIPNESRPNYRYAYKYPAIAVAIHGITLQPGTDNDPRFRTMAAAYDGGVKQAIFSNVDNAVFSATARIEDVLQYPPEFVDVLAYWLAHYLAIPLTGKAELMLGMQKLANTAAERAAGISSGVESRDEGEQSERDGALIESTRLDLANRALQNLGLEPISSFGMRSKSGDAVRRFYANSILTALRAGDWPFARYYTLGILIPNRNTPNWRFAYEFPPAAAAVRGVDLKDENDGDNRFRQMLTSYGGKLQPAIFTNVESALFICTSKEVSVEQYPPEFMEAAALYLSAMLAVPLIGKADVAAEMQKSAEAAVQRAVAISAAIETANEGVSLGRSAPLVEATPLDMANRALQALQVEPISSLGMRSVSADAVRRFYRNALRATLRAVDWNFARRYFAATAVARADVPGHSYAFAVPVDCVAFRGFALRRSVDPRIRYVFATAGAGRQIYTGISAGVMIYTSDAAGVESYDPDFVSVFTYMLAQDIAPACGKPQAVPLMSRLAQGAIATAAANNYNEETHDLDDDVPDWLAVRGVPSLTREEAASPERGEWQQGPGAFILPGQQANPQPPMVTQMAEQIRPAYIPGLTAPREAPPPILGNSDFTVEAIGGRLEADGRLVKDDPSTSPFLLYDDEDLT